MSQSCGKWITALLKINKIYLSQHHKLLIIHLTKVDFPFYAASLRLYFHQMYYYAFSDVLIAILIPTIELCPSNTSFQQQPKPISPFPWCPSEPWLEALSSFEYSFHWRYQSAGAQIFKDAAVWISPRFLSEITKTEKRLFVISQEEGAGSCVQRLMCCHK